MNAIVDHLRDRTLPRQNKKAATATIADVEEAVAALERRMKPLILRTIREQKEEA